MHNKIFFYGLILVLGGLTLWLVSSYLDIIVFSLVMVVILKPVYDFFQRRLKLGSTLASALTLITMFLAVLIPLLFSLRVINSQLTQLAEDLITPQGAGQMTVEEFQAELNDYLQQVPGGNRLQLSDEQAANIRQGVVDGAVWLGGKMVNLGMSFPSMIARVFIFFAIVGGLLPNYRAFVDKLLFLSPLDDAIDRLYLRRIKAMTWSMFIGIVVIALIQGLVTGFFIWLAGVPYAALWTLIAIITSALPLGSSLIAIPVALVQMVIGNYTGGLIVLGGYILIVTNIDNIIRPRLVSREAYLDTALVLIAALGGYELFGFFGVIYGPVLMILAMTTIEVYGLYYAPGQQTALSAAVVTSDNGSETALTNIQSSHTPNKETHYE